MSGQVEPEGGFSRAAFLIGETTAQAMAPIFFFCNL